MIFDFGFVRNQRLLSANGDWIFNFASIFFRKAKAFCFLENDKFKIRAVRNANWQNCDLPNYAVVVAVIAGASLESAEFLMELDGGNGA